MVDLKKRVTPKLIVCYVLILLFVLWARPTPVTLAAGLPLIVVGELIRIWGTGHLRKNADVITSGPYSYIRDPLYLGTLLILTGFCLAGRTGVLLIVVWGLFFVYYMPYKQRREGDRLARKFGDAYRCYREQVRSLVPRITPYRGPDARIRWSGRLVVDNSEIGTAVSAAIFYIVLVLKHLFYSDLVFPAWHLF